MRFLCINALNGLYRKLYKVSSSAYTNQNVLVSFLPSLVIDLAIKLNDVETMNLAPSKILKSKTSLSQYYKHLANSLGYYLSVIIAELADPKIWNTKL